MRWNIRRHTDGDTHGAIQKQLRKLSWKNGRFLVHAIEVRNEINGILFDIQKHFLGNRRKLRFRITIRSRSISVHGTEVSLPPNERVSQRKILRHTDHRIVHRRITMRMILSQHFTDHGRRFAELRT